MSDENPGEEATVEQAVENAQEVATDALETVSDYIRANPWAVVAGAVVLGGILAALVARPKEPPSKIELLSQWLEEQGEHLPSRKKLQAKAKSLGLPSSLHELKKILHFA